MKCSLGISNFLEEISSLSHSVVFLFLCIDRWGRLSYLFLLFFGTLYSDACIFFFSSLLFSSLLFTAICKASPDSHFPFLRFFSTSLRVTAKLNCTFSCFLCLILALPLSEIPALNPPLKRGLRCGECEALSSGLLNVCLGEETSEKNGICWWLH